MHPRKGLLADIGRPMRLFIVHYCNRRAMAKRGQGFRSAQSWFQDSSKVGMENEDQVVSFD
jgi:hypothetical protein